MISFKFIHHVDNRMPNRIHKIPSKEISATYQKTVLSNGIRVVSEEIPHVKSISIGVWIDTGSRNETESTNGISHFLEHMVFKGTDTARHSK